MPIRPRKIDRAKRGWTDADRAFLFTGNDRFHESAFGPFPRTKVAYRLREGLVKVDVAQQAWEDLRDELLAEFIAGHPGHRPWAWWTFNAPDRRLCLNQVHPFDDPRRQGKVDCVAAEPCTAADYRDGCYRLSFGKPAMLVYFSDDGDDGSPDDTTAIYESEIAFLARHGLLLDAEQKLLAAGAVEEADE